MSDICWKCHENLFNNFSIILLTTEIEKAFLYLRSQMQHLQYVIDCSLCNCWTIPTISWKSIHLLFSNIVKRHKFTKKTPISKGLNITSPSYSRLLFLPHVTYHTDFMWFTSASVFWKYYWQTNKPTEIKSSSSPFGGGDETECTSTIYHAIINTFKSFKMGIEFQWLVHILNIYIDWPVVCDIKLNISISLMIMMKNFNQYT